MVRKKSKQKLTKQLIRGYVLSHSIHDKKLNETVSLIDGKNAQPLIDYLSDSSQPVEEIKTYLSVEVGEVLTNPYYGYGSIQQVGWCHCK